MSIKGSPIRIFKTRNSATALLSKLGVPQPSYKDYISEQDGEFYVDAEEAAATWGKRTAYASKPMTHGPRVAVEPQRRHKTTKTPRAKKPTIAARCLVLFKDGKDNDATWKVLKREFHLPETRRHYPSWYRSYFKRTGALKGGRRHAR